jgi:hypothetical protein
MNLKLDENVPTNLLFATKSMLFFNAFFTSNVNNLIRITGYFIHLFGTINDPRAIPFSQWQFL